MKKITVISLLAVTAIYAVNEEPKKEMPPIVKEGVGYIKMMGKELKMNMKKHMKADKSGVAAAKFCSQKATTIAQEVSKKYPKGVRVYRTSLKVRSDANKPDETDKKVLENLQKEMDSKTFVKKPTVVKLEDGKTRVYVPLLVEKACVKCHGDTSKMNPEVKKIINERYPNDKAIGFKEGDLRGVIVAEMPNKK